MCMQSRRAAWQRQAGRLHPPVPAPARPPLGMGTGSISAQDAVQGGWQGFGGPSCTALLPISCLPHGARGALPGRALPVAVLVPGFRPCRHVPVTLPFISPTVSNWPARPQNSRRVQENLLPKKINMFCALSELPTVKQIRAQLGPITALFLKNESVQPKPSWHI